MLNVVIHRDGDFWVAQGLEHDIAAQGATIQEAKDNFRSTLETQIHFDILDGKQPLEDVGPAPPHYRVGLERLLRCGPQLPRVVPKEQP
jgi:predicted RNase H-like HicB family nuclease